MRLCKSRYVESLRKKEQCIRESFKFDPQRGSDQLSDHPYGIHARIAFGEMQMCSFLRSQVPDDDSLNGCLLVQDLLLLAESRAEIFDFNPNYGVDQLKGDLAAEDAVLAYAESRLCISLINWIEVGFLLQH